MSAVPAEGGHRPAPGRSRDGAGCGPETAAPHPEEMKATVDLRLGQSLSIRATARATPAGLAAAALLAAAVIVPLAWLAGPRRRGRPG